MTGRPTSGAMPGLVPPMQPSVGSGDPPTGPDWVVEVAWTGHRCIAYVQPGRRVRLLSATDTSVSSVYPELAEPLLRRCPPGGMVLDGTVVARGEEHAPRAKLLMRRSGRHRPSEAVIREVPVDFQVADLLWLDGHSTTAMPWADRRALLDALGFASPPVWATSPLPATEIDALLDIAEQKGAEGLHARHVRGRYHPGGRSRFWVRIPVKQVRQVRVGGWTPASAGRPESVGALLLGAPASTPGPAPGEAPLHYVGRVGVATEERDRLAPLLVAHRRDRSPFAGEPPADAARHASWTDAALVGLVEYAGWTGGTRMRRPRWHGLLAPGDLRDARWARPPGLPTAPAAVPLPAPRAPGAEPAAPSPAAPARRLEQHFVYNALNTIAALIRTDPARARELLVGFADLSRATDRAAEAAGAAVPLSGELAAVRAYLELERARFGRRLSASVDVDPALDAAALDRLHLRPLALLAAVRDAVQQRVEPDPGGGEVVVRVGAPAAGAGASVEVAVRIGDRVDVAPVVLVAGPRPGTVTTG